MTMSACSPDASSQLAPPSGRRERSSITRSPPPSHARPRRARSPAPAPGVALLAKVQSPAPAPFNLSELDPRLSILAQIANHLYDDLIDCGTTQLAALEQKNFARARGERAVMCNDDHPNLEVID